MHTAITKSIDLASKIKKGLKENWRDEIENYGLDCLFPIYNIPMASNEEKNILCCYVIYAYNPDSLWLDLKKDRIQNKRKIISSLGGNVKSEFYSDVIENKNENVNMAIFSFLEELKDWRWRSVFDLIEYAAKMSRFASTDTDDERRFEKKTKDGQVQQFTEEVDIEKITKVNAEKGKLIEKARQARENANNIIEQIKKDFVSTDSATTEDFGFSFSETSKKRDILSWRDYIRERNEKKRLLNG